MKIVNLDENVLLSLEFLEKNLPKKFDTNNLGIPLVAGSGNALNTGKILFSDSAAIFSDESTFRQTLKSYKEAITKKLVTHAVIISASGEKDSVWELQEARDHGLNTILLTCQENSSAEKVADKTIIYKKIAEPYTYNFSTYLGMILGKTNESPREILKFLNKVKINSNLSDYESYSFIFPDKFGEVGPMIEIKRNELFGPHLSLRAFTLGRARHAGFVHPWEKELVISIGKKNEYFGDPNHRFDLAIPESANYGLVLSLSYYLVGKIQLAKYPYFKENIEKFCNDYGPKAYGSQQTFEVIVPGSK